MIKLPPQCLSKGESGRNRLYTRYKIKARHRKLLFNLSKEVFTKLTSSKCFYCGHKPELISRENNKTKIGIRHSEYTYNGLDRIDNTKGYTIDNVVPCCRVHNEWKRAMSYKNFVKLIHKTSQFLKEKGIK